MTKKRDLRIEKTYDALIEAFKKLLLEKSFEEITIKELCEKARIRPATFYTHFKDKYDFFAFLVKEIRETYLDLSPSDTADEDIITYFTHLVERGLNFIVTNEAFLKAMDTSSILTVILHSVTETTNQDLQKRLMNAKENGAILLAEPPFLTQIILGSLSQTCRWWTDHQDTVTKEEMLKQWTDMIHKFVHY